MKSKDNFESSAAVDGHFLDSCYFGRYVRFYVKECLSVPYPQKSESTEQVYDDAIQRGSKTRELRGREYPATVFPTPDSA